MVVFPVPPFCDRTAIAADIGRTIWPLRERILALRHVCPRRAPARRRRGSREVSMSGSSRSSVAAARSGAAFLTRAGVSPAGLAAERRGSRRVRDLRLGAQGRDAEPRAGGARAGEPPEDAPPRRATSTARATAAASWSTSRAGSGPRRSAPAATTRRSRSTPRSRSPTSSSIARRTLEKARHDAREILGRGGFRILAERLGAVDSQALGPTAREEEPHFWQVGGLLPDAKRRAPHLLRPDARARGGARLPRRLVLGHRPASTR